MIPIHVLKEGKSLPKPGSCYVIAKNGHFIRKDTNLIKAVVPVRGDIVGLSAMEPAVSLRLPKVPVELVIRSLLFFRSVWKRWQSEAITLLHFSTKQRRYLLWCPKQKVMGLRIFSYDPDDRFKDFQLVGTIHSHVNVSAGHSGIDHHDEINFDGVHVTIGHVAEPHSFSLSASVMVNGFRFVKDQAELLEGISEIDSGRFDAKIDYRAIQFPRHWLKKVRCEADAHQGYRLGRHRLLSDRPAPALSGLFGQG